MVRNRACSRAKTKPKVSRGARRRAVPGHSTKWVFSFEIWWSVVGLHDAESFARTDRYRINQVIEAQCKLGNRMARLGSIAVGLAAIVLLAAGCGGVDGSHRGDARTYYESLDLDSPLAAAEVLIDAFARDDFMTVWLALDSEAQFRFISAFNLMDYSQIIHTDAVPDLANWLSHSFRFEELESSDSWYFFDLFMLMADENDAFLIDLSTDVELGDLNQSEDEADVSASVAGIDGDVAIHLTRNAHGRWRVRQVIAPRGNEDQIPWSVPSTGS
jgi:hypothetical protein